MQAIAQEGPMTKRKGRPRKPGGEGTPVRVDTDLVTMARYICAKEGVPLSELLSDLLRPAVLREFKKLGKEFLGDINDER